MMNMMMLHSLGQWTVSGFPDDNDVDDNGDIYDDADDDNAAGTMIVDNVWVS